jgi:hypothetical protein
MVSISTGLTLGLIATAVLGFYKLGGASGIGSRLGGGFSSLFDSFGSSLNPVQAAIDKNNAENPALNPTLVAQARFEEATTLDPNLSADRFIDPAGKYDPLNPYGDSPKIIEPISTTAPPNFMDQFTFTDRPTRPTTPAITYGPLPQYAGTLEYVTQNMVSAPYEGPTQSKPTTLDYNFLGNFGV